MTQEMAQSQMPIGETRDWMPDHHMALWLNLAGVAVSLIALIPFLTVYAFSHAGQSGFELTGQQLLVAIVLTLALTGAALVCHEYIHGVAIKRAGGTPAYGAKMIGKFLPVFYATSEGQRFTRKDFIVIALAPFIVLSLGFALLIALLLFGGWLVLPAALHAGGCAGDIVMAWKVWREPPGTLVEDRIAGLRFYPPT